MKDAKTYDAMYEAVTTRTAEELSEEIDIECFLCTADCEKCPKFED